ncbi:MAG: transcriptional repressor NrdR [Victivallales bacterium]|nr:transcriptional repressor NrdR [Victivallales bacterium]
MRCPNCSSTEDKVIETRISKEGDTIRRRRQCAACGQRYTTYETIIPAELFVIKKNGMKVDFKPEKILSGIRQACWKRNVSEEQIDRMVAHVTNRISMEMNSNNEIASQKIGEFVMDELKKVDEVAYIRFASVYRHFKDAEAFVNEVQNLPSQNSEPTEPPNK